MSATYHVLATADFSQDWSNTGLITVNDDWSGVPSIIGYRGDGLTGATGADPQTLLAADAAPVVDVNANQTNPSSFTTGGVAEFEITDPTVALNGSGTADAPYLQIFLDTTGRSAITLTFNLRDLDGSADDATQQVAVHYRVGETGDWTNLPGAYVADATDPNTATKVTPVSVVLPVAAEDQAQLQVRIMTTNAAGNDEWVGIDDILVTSTGGAAVETLSIAAADADKAEGDAGSTDFTFTVTRTNGDGEAGATWTVGAPGGAGNAAADDFAGPLTGTVSFAAGETEQTITIAVAGDGTSEADEAFTVTLSDPTGGAVIGVASAAGTIRNDDVSTVLISAVQGSGADSPLVGQTVTVEAIVVGDFQNGDADDGRNLTGFYLQEEDADADGNAATSEGLFVFQGGALGDVAVGDKVQVTGTVGEFFGQTQITAASITVVSSGNALPTAAEILLPAAATTLSQNGDVQPDLEAYEGMLVRFPQVLTITEQFQLDRFNEIKLVAGDRPAQFTQENLPSVSGYQAALEEVGARTITYDDGLNDQNAPIGNLDGFGPTYTTANAPRMGDTITGLTGVLDYQWAGNSASGSTWRVRAVEDGANTFDEGDPRPATPPDVGGTLQVASFNVLNFFTTIDAPGVNTAIGQDPRGADSAEELARQQEKLLTTLDLLGADIIGLIELENDFEPGAPGNAIEKIVNELNTLEGADVWNWVNPNTKFVGTDAIAVGFIYRVDEVQIAEGTTIGVLDTGLIAESGRAPVAVSFEDLDSGEVFTVTVNHFKSKGTAATLPGDADAGDGQGLSNATRVQQAQELLDWLATDPTGAADDDVLIIGDLNAYAKEDPIALIESAGFVNLEPAGAYSFVFDGLTGSLDHALASPTLAAKVSGAAPWAINADEADALDYNLDFGRDAAIFDGTVPFRTSDHDPLIVGLDFPPAPETFTLQLLHFADAEAGLLASRTAPNLAALVDAFDGTYANTLILAGGDNFLPGPFLAAGTDASVAATHSRGNNPGAADIEIHNRIGVEASTIGNHEFDLGTNAFSDVVNDAAFPYLSANLDFSGDSALAGRYQETVGTGGLEDAATLARKIVPSAVVTKGNEVIGLVGATTQIVETISSTGGVEVKGFAGDGAETNDMALLASQLQVVIDDLRGQGVDKIILMAHLQQIAFETQLAPLLEGVDIILAAGSNTRLGDADDVPVAFPGHAADFADTYPIVTAGKDGKTTVIVNTDNEFTYLGRLVVEFDANGEIITDSLTDNLAINGAYASTDANVAAAWGVAEADLATTAFADGTKGAEVKEITDAVDAVIAAKDGQVWGFTEVYLEGERNLVRNQETNLGNITADANLEAARDALGDTLLVGSLKNGGGIRAQIGSIDFVTGDKEPPLANPDAGKPEGGVSTLDIENSLRFNNRLMVFDTDAAGLKAILEHGVAVLGNQGRFPQIGGISLSYDPDLPAGSRILNLAIIDADGNVLAKLVEGGVVNPDAPATISMVTLNFLANGGDGYPMKANGSNFRYLLDDGTVGPAIDEALDFTTVAPANALGEQQAMQEFMQEFHGTPDAAFDQADTAPAGDTRIQDLNAREDAVFEGISLIGAGVLEGTGRDDGISGRFGDDSILAGFGDDTVLGRGGDDTIDGGEGDDRIFAATGDDSVTAGGGADIVLGEAGDDTLDGGAGDDALNGGLGRDLLLGGEGSDTLEGGLREDTLDGGADDDLLRGEIGSDSLAGGAGNDTLEGGFGQDTLAGGEGDDLLAGGLGPDIFVFGAGAPNGDDIVLDFTPADRILLEAGLGITGTNRIDTDSNGILDLVLDLSDGGSITLIDVPKLTPVAIVFG